MSEDWPSPHHHEPNPLPRVEDLPVAWEGYDRERVQAAFDAFYRHIAQLDSTLRTLEAVEVFRGQAGELRAELRSMRSAGWAPYPRGYTLTPERSMLGSVPDAVPRIALEVIFLIVAAAVVAVAEFSPLEIVAVMAGAALLVLLVELVAGRERRASTPIPAEAPMAVSAPPPEPVRPIPAPAPPQAAVPAPAPAPAPAPDANQPTTGELSLVPVPDLPQEEEALVEEEVGGWAPFAEPAGEEAPNVMAALAVADDGVPDEPAAEAEPLPEPVAEAEPEPLAEVEPEPVAEVEPDPEPEPVAEAEPDGATDVEPEPGGAEVEPEPEADAEPIAGVADAETGIIPRRRLFGRRRRDVPAAEPDADAPKHVRVLPPRETAVAEAELPPWERGFDDTEERRPGA
jgi:hypothetical protein